MAHCRAYLAAYKLPRKIQFVSDLPRPELRQIMRRELATIDDELEAVAG